MFILYSLPHRNIDFYFDEILSVKKVKHRIETSIQSTMYYLRSNKIHLYLLLTYVVKKLRLREISAVKNYFNALASKASRMPFPNKVKAKTISIMAKPGKIAKNAALSVIK